MKISTYTFLYFFGLMQGTLLGALLVITMGEAR